MNKPHISICKDRVSAVLLKLLKAEHWWKCKNEVAVGYGGTPQEAFIDWLDKSRF